MFNVAVIIPAFLAAGVEWVEAFTIVFAVGLTIGWRAAAGAAFAALAVLAVMTVSMGGVLSLGVNIAALQFLIGVFLLLFGVRWLAKAIARQAGLKPLRSEADEFNKVRARLSGGDWSGSWIIAFKGVLLEGLEVWLIVVAMGGHGGWASLAGAALGALAALAVVIAAGVIIGAPLARLPENVIKFTVGAAIVSFGTFWMLEALGGPTVWPGHDWSLPGLFVFYAGGGLAMVSAVRRFSRGRSVL
ncbi:MAG: hypothetical protein F8N37_09920 [Telmatospirillum sp.]|nr:hypothetical protein [Telmatospirillum sp.]